MTCNEKNNSGWAAVGKATAALGGIAALAGACYGLYYWGNTNGQKQGAYQAEKELVAEGRLLPENSCYRYAPSDDEEVVFDGWDYKGSWELSGTNPQTEHVFTTKNCGSNFSVIVTKNPDRTTAETVYVRGYRLIAEQNNPLKISYKTSEDWVNMSLTSLK